MSLVIPGLGKTITPKRRRPSPKAKIIRRGTVKPIPGIVNDKPTPKAPSRPKRPVVGRPTSSGGGKKFDAPGGSAPSRPSRKKSTFGKKYEGPMRPGMGPKPKPKPIKANSKRGARPISSPARRPRGRR